MPNWILLLLAAVVAASIGFVGQLLSTPERAAPESQPGTAELLATLGELRAEQTRLAERLAALPSSAPGVPASTRAPVVDLDEAIAAYMAKQLSTGTFPGPGEMADSVPSDIESAAIADRIVSGLVRGDELEALWQKLRDEDRIDGVVAAIERQAELTPNNPDMQSELGKAYIQKLFDVGVGPMASAWGQKADQAFDRALELDESHWEARFSKAVALSNWPTFLGKQGEAVRQFEILMAQQEHGAPASEHAWTYYFLGNMYDQIGQREKALDAWKRGSTRFPENADLRQKMEVH